MDNSRPSDSTASNSRYSFILNRGLGRGTGVTRPVPVDEVIVASVLFLCKRARGLLIIGFIINLRFLSEVSKALVWPEEVAEPLKAWFCR
jgi:hypothetical protein